MPEKNEKERIDFLANLLLRDGWRVREYGDDKTLIELKDSGDEFEAIITYIVDEKFYTLSAIRTAHPGILSYILRFFEKNNLKVEYSDTYTLDSDGEVVWEDEYKKAPENDDESEDEDENEEEIIEEEKSEKDEDNKTPLGKAMKVVGKFSISS